MNKLLTVLFIAFLISVLIVPASAEDLYSSAAKEFGADSLDDILTEEEKSIGGEFSAKGNYNVGAALARLWAKFVSYINRELGENLHFCLSLAALALLCSIASALCSSKEINFFIELTACSSAAIILLGGVDSLVSETVNAMYRLSDYSKAALPVVFTAAAAAGAVSSATTKFAAVSFALDVLMSISQRLIIPSVYAFLALAVANSLFPNPLLATVQKFFKWTCGTLMTAMTMAFTAYINMVGAIGAAVDTAAVKTARSFISGVLPVVGGMISDASAMILSAAGVVKNCAGVYGLIAVASMCVGPFALLSVKMLMLKAVSACTESLQVTKLSALYSGLASAMGLLLGLLGSCGIMLFISLTAGMKAVNI